jgi:hypothetical protein
MSSKAMGWTVGVIGMVLIAASMPRAAYADDRVSSQTLKRILQELNDLKAERARADKKIDDLEQKIETIQGQNQKLQEANQQLKSDTSQKIETIQTQVSTSTSRSAFEGSFGEHQFVAAGGGAITYLYDHKSNINTFGAEFEPLFLYRLNDWILFQGVIDAAFPSGSGASLDVPVATAQIFLNDYVELNAGLFDLPFGDFNEDQSVFWANRFVTNPLPYGGNSPLPSSDLGVQLRGGVQWGQLGQDVDYTAYAANGPLYDTSLPAPVVGQAFNGNNNIATSSHGKAYGGRVRVYPLPLDWDWGRLELGASSYDGKWQNALWLTSWGVDFNYRADTFEARGEYLGTHRRMPNGAAADNRQGWYIQGGYYLTKLHPSFLSPAIRDQLAKMELLVRYSGLNQRAVVASEIPTEPGSLGEDASPSLFAPHPREVALGLDYWIAPSIVWKLEYDMELPRAGGSLVTFDASGAPVFKAIGATPNDKAILTQLAIGF